MNVVCVVTCDDCGKSIIEDPSKISMFFMGDILGVTQCPKCGEPIFVNLSKEITIRIKSI